MSEQTASEAIYEAQRAKLTTEYLQRSEHARIEAISRHYTSLAIMALHLKQVSERRLWANQSSAPTDEFINFTVQQIIAQHVTDFGVEPSWARMWTPLQA